MAYILKLDSREHALIACFQNNQAANVTPCCLFTLEVEQLDVGDVMVIHNNCCKLLIERKTPSDLNSSLVDGRWIDQRKRMCQTVEVSHPITRRMILIEGSRTDLSTGADGAIASWLMRGSGSVIYTNDTIDTMHTIIRLIKKIHEADSDSAGVWDSAPIPLRGGVHKRKADNMTEGSHLLVSQLMQIPSVSRRVAEAIVGENRCMYEFLSHPTACQTYTIAGLFPLGSKRRIGDAVANRVVNALRGHTRVQSEDVLKEEILEVADNTLQK
jgi:hypothetical protein